MYLSLLAVHYSEFMVGIKLLSLKRGYLYHKLYLSLLAVRQSPFAVRPSEFMVGIKLLSLKKGYLNHKVYLSLLTVCLSPFR